MDAEWHYTKSFKHAAVWKRLPAALIDYGAVAVASGLIDRIILPSLVSMARYFNDGSDAGLRKATIVLQASLAVINILIACLYFSLYESGSNQATLGKQLLGIYVTNLAGKPVGVAQAVGRFFGKFISALILGIGFIMAAFTPKKQALHDMLAGTLVIEGKPRE